MCKYAMRAVKRVIVYTGYDDQQRNSINICVQLVLDAACPACVTHCRLTVTTARRGLFCGVQNRCRKLKSASSRIINSYLILLNVSRINPR